MIPQYSIVNSCLMLLKQSDWETTKRLQVEIKLIQIKRYLLDENLPVAIKRGSCSETVFNELLHQMKGISEAQWELDGFNPLRRGDGSTREVGIRRRKLFIYQCLVPLSLMGPKTRPQISIYQCLAPSPTGSRQSQNISQSINKANKAVPPYGGRLY